jgi:hypothetical protein
MYRGHIITDATRKAQSPCALQMQCCQQPHGIGVMALMPLEIVLPPTI